MKLIKLPEGYIVTSEISPFPNEKVFSIVTNTVTTFTDPRHFSDNTYFKIIASTFHPELPQIEFDLLSNEDAKEIGYIDVEKLALLNCKVPIKNHKEQDLNTEIWISGARQLGFKEGFQKAQSLSDKMFSLEDIKRFGAFMQQRHTGVDESLNYFISQPKQWDIEATEKNGKVKINKIL